MKATAMQSSRALSRIRFFLRLAHQIEAD